MIRLIKRILFILTLTGIFELVYSVCRDKVTNCRPALHMCYAGGVGQTVRDNCMHSCGLCTPSTSPPKLSPQKESLHRADKCVDDPICHTLNKKDFCYEEHVKYRKKFDLCPKLCGICDENSHHSHESNTTKRPKKRKITRKTSKRRSTPKVEARTVPFEPIFTQPTPKPHPDKPTQKHPLFEKFLNEGADKCDNFYEFTCGNYIKNHKNQNRWPTKDIQEDVIRQRQIKLIFDDSPTTSTSVTKMREFRKACMDEPPVNKLGTTELRADLDEIGNCPMFKPTWVMSGSDVKTSFTKLHTDLSRIASRYYLFDISVRKDDSTGNYMLFITPQMLIADDPKIYARKDQKAADAIKSLLKNVLKTVSDDGGYKITDDNLGKAIDEIMKYDMDTAKVYVENDFISQRKAVSKFPDKVKFSDLQGIYSHIDWKSYIKGNTLLPDSIKTKIDSDPNYEVLFYNKKLLTDLEKLFDATDYKVIVNYYVTRLILNHIQYLDKRFTDAIQNYNGKIDGRVGRSNRQELCVDSIVELFTFVNTYLYVQSYFDDTRSSAFKGEISTKTGVKELIESNTWLTPTTKKAAAEKVNSVMIQFGSATKLRDIAYIDGAYSTYDVNPSKYSLRRMYVNFKREMSQKFTTETRDSSIWYKLQSTEVDDIYYIYNENYLYVTAALVESTIFDNTMTRAYNYGSISTMIAKRVLKSLDTTGIQYDDKGKSANWFTKASIAEFNKRTKSLADQYSAIKDPQVSLNLKGQQILEETISDSAAVKGSFLAYKRKMNGVTESDTILGDKTYTPEQMFFIGYGMSMCTAATDDFMKTLVEEGDRAPGMHLVNTVLANYPEFAKAFNCQAGTKMNPESRVEVW